MYNPKTAVANYAHSLCKKKKSHLDRWVGEAPSSWSHKQTRTYLA
jgi:hypothetical protein